jgi:hypothetical protein
MKWEAVRNAVKGAYQEMGTDGRIINSTKRFEYLLREFTGQDRDYH